MWESHLELVLPPPPPPPPLPPLPPPPVPAPELLVEYEPPAGLPAVELGLVLFKQELSLLAGVWTVKGLLPALPFPRSSPPTRIKVVIPRSGGVHEKPVPWPWLSMLVMEPWGIANELPPGMTPWNVGLL
jgi:hypothetical protein